jgi:hypothetical protein
MTTTQHPLLDIEPDRVRDLSTDVWATADRDGRYLMRIYATVLSRRTRPVLGPWPRAVHLRGSRRDLEESTDEIVWHHDYLPDADITEVGGLFATSRLRTMVDLARTQPFRSAVISLDAALQERFVTPSGVVLPAIPREHLLARVRSLPQDRAAARARQAAAFADGRSGSSGQSLSRATMHLARLPLPTLQAECRHAWGSDRVDFRWERRFHVKRLVLLGEFDCGIEQRRDRVRDSRLADADRALVRWRWADALHPARLGAVLGAAGLAANP